VIYLTDATFDAQTTGGRSLILIASKWSVKGNRIAKQIDSLSPPDISLFRIDPDESPELIMRYSIRESPFILYMVDGEVVESDVTLSEKLLALVE